MTWLPLRDCEVRTAPVPASLEGATAGGVLWQASPGRFLLAVPDVARYLVTDGRAIAIEPASGASDAAVTRFLATTPCAALLYQRGVLALHAAACIPPAAVGTTAILIAGDSGAGKSTLLAALVQRGWRVLADDLAIVDVDQRGQPLVWPHPSPMRLPPDMQGALRWPGQMPVQASPTAAAQPLKTLYWLTVHGPGATEVSDLSGAERFAAVGALTYNTRIAAVLLDRAAFLRQAGAIAQRAAVVRLRRPRGAADAAAAVAHLAGVIEAREVGASLA